MPLHCFLIVCMLLALAPAARAQDATANKAAVRPDSLHLVQIAEAGTLAGEIEACEVDWKTYYIAYMQSERRRAANEEWPQEKIAFVGALFGAFQGRSYDEHREEACPLERLPALAGRMDVVMDAARAREGGEGSAP